MSTGWRLFVIVGGAAMAVLGGWVVRTGFSDQSARNVGSGPFLAVVGAMLVGFGVGCIGSAFRYRLTLRADSIELRGVFVTRELRREEIAGRRFVSGRNGSFTVLYPRDEQVKRLKIPTTFRTDSAADAWLSGIPDLDQEEAEKFEAEIEADAELGATVEERRARLAQAKRTANILMVVAIAASLWAWIYPKPYAAAMLCVAALPLITVALMASSKGLYQIGTRRNDPRPSLGIPFLFPSLGLMHTVPAQNFLAWKPVFSAALLLTALLVLVLAVSDVTVRRSGGMMFIVAMVAGVYALGAAVQADVLLDRSQPRTFETFVLAHRETRDSRSTSFYLRLAPWEPGQEPIELSVPRELYVSVREGQRVCITLHEGALKAAWYVVAACEQLVP